MKKGLSIILILLLCSILWIGRGFISQKSQAVPTMKNLANNTNFSVIAHRGNSSEAPENTLPAFKQAIALGVDMIELDVHLTKDGRLVVLHDVLLDRTTSGTGFVKDYTYQELQKLDAGSWFSQHFKGEQLPLLEDILTLAKGQTIVLIEIKRAKDFVYTGLEKKLVALIRKQQFEKQCIIQSFEKSYLENMYKIAPALEYQLLVVSDLEPFPYYADNYYVFKKYENVPFYKAINPYFKLLSEGKVKQLQTQGLKVSPYTVNELDDMKKIIGMGVNGIITNYPKRLLELRTALQNQ